MLPLCCAASSKFNTLFQTSATSYELLVLSFMRLLTMFFLAGLGLGVGEASGRVGAEPAVDVVHRDLVDVDLELLLEVVKAELVFVFLV